MTIQHREIWDLYSAAWKAETKEEKLDLFTKSLSKDCIYRDPLIVAEGWDALLSYMLEFHEMIPGGHFVTREFKFHHNRSITEWNMCLRDGTVAGTGISYGEYNDAGQLKSMCGFFEPLETN